MRPLNVNDHVACTGATDNNQRLLRHVCIPFCLSVCRSFRDLQPTTIDRSQPNLVGRSPDPCKPFWIPSPILWVPEGKICKISPISNAYSCHCKRDASCHTTCHYISGLYSNNNSCICRLSTVVTARRAFNRWSHSTYCLYTITITTCLSMAIKFTIRFSRTRRGFEVFSRILTKVAQYSMHATSSSSSSWGLWIC